MSPLEILDRYREGFLGGLSTTVAMALWIWGIGVAVGALLGVFCTRFRRIVGWPCRAVAFVLASVPVIVLLYWAYYPLQVLSGVSLTPFSTAVLVLALVNVFAVADLVRNNILNLPSEYVLAARACGLSESQVVRSIQIPLIVRHLWPSLLPLQISMLHATLFASLISVDELFRVSQRVNAVVYQPVEIYTGLALLFLITCLPVNLLAHYLRSRLARDLSER